MSGYAAAAHPGTWTVRLKLTPGRDYTARFELYGPPVALPPVSATPLPAPALAPIPPSSPGTWKVDDYTLMVVDSIKVSYSATGAHVTLVIARPDGRGWEFVDDVAVDTGAAETMLPLELAQALGIDPRTGKRIELSGVTGSDVGWEHKLRMEKAPRPRRSVIPVEPHLRGADADDSGAPSGGLIPAVFRFPQNHDHRLD